MKTLVYLFFGVNVIIFNIGFAQENIKDSGNDKIYDVTEIQAEFPGGMDKMYEFVYNTVSYPKDALKKKIEGTVYVQFVVEKDGSLSNVIILRGVSKSLDKEVLKMVDKMPSWIPGKIKGKIVRYRFTLPVKFSLEKKGEESDK